MFKEALTDLASMLCKNRRSERFDSGDGSDGQCPMWGAKNTSILHPCWFILCIVSLRVSRLSTTTSTWLRRTTSVAIDVERSVCQKKGFQSPLEQRNVKKEFQEPDQERQKMKRKKGATRPLVDCCLLAGAACLLRCFLRFDSFVSSSAMGA